MATTKKYIIVDDTDTPIGHILLKEPTSYEHVAPGPIHVSGPVADASLFAVVLTGFTLTPLLAGAPGWAAATVGITLTATLAGIKAWRGTLRPGSEPKSDEIIFKGEFIDRDTGTIHFDEISDTSIKPPTLVKFCAAVENNGFVWVGRPRAKLQYNISRSQHERIRAAFDDLGYIRDDNQITGRGRLFVRKVAAHRLKT